MDRVDPGGKILKTQEDMSDADGDRGYVGDTGDESWEDVEGGDVAPITPSVRSKDEDVVDDLSQGEATGEEGRSPMGLRAPQVVTKAEREEHEKTHIPYRCWCRACVRGRRKKRAHRQKSQKDKEDERDTGVPRVSMD